MKKIINGKIYDTDTAKEIDSISHGDGPRDFRYYHEVLYRKRTGEYFLFPDYESADGRTEDAGWVCPIG